MPPNNKRRAVSLVKTILQDILHSPSLDDFKDAPHSTLRALPAFDVRAPVPLAGPTSWQALVSDGKPQKDRRVCSSSAVAVARGGSTRHWVYDTSVEFESWNDGMQKELKEPVGIFATFGVIDKPIDPPIGAGSTRPSTCQPPSTCCQKKRGQSGTLTNAASWTPKQIYNLLYSEGLLPLLLNCCVGTRWWICARVEPPCRYFGGRSISTKVCMSDSSGSLMATGAKASPYSRTRRAVSLVKKELQE
ncbi:hypothetical protein PF008_g19657 [Phytophthora fragariae]|uniref:Uncharacterized protein n=1 Tax=Phytophthora fragariae TaxID=53985 RepID=A0A6G0R1R9_9STRA|nr:hypothetical protein PF008_g19657 [Phytophthora fragariae]